MNLGKLSILTGAMLLLLLAAGCPGREAGTPDGQEGTETEANTAEQEAVVDNSNPDLRIDYRDAEDEGLPRVGNTSFKGRGDCFSCHRELVVGYRRTAHDLATVKMDAAFIAGDFNEAEYADGLGSARFFRDGERYMVRTAPPGGTEQDFTVAWGLGGQSVQQYALETGDGRIQVLDIGWDLRPASEGGQRWFRIPDGGVHERSGGRDWTGWNANWNTNCARCHSSELKPEFDNESRSFSTYIAEEDVTCESCHGGGKIHIGWAEGVKAGQPGRVARKGLIFYLTGRDYEWELDPQTGSARRDPPRSERKEVETCMMCHALYRPYISEIRHDRDPFHFIDLELLTEGLYHPDGQIADVQVYETGSFLQSREYRAGVTCADCHDPHTGYTWEDGNDLCLRCHDAAQFDMEQHHFHPAGSEGSSCVACHMPANDYLGADTRHDHSFRVPRPDLTQQIGTPNTCSSCHGDMAIEEIVAAWQGWYGTEHPPHYGTVFATARRGDPRCIPQLEEMATDLQQPHIVRATAFTELARFASPTSLPAITHGLQEAESIVRLAAVKACGAYGPSVREELLKPMLGDRLQSIQVELGRMLAMVEMTGLDEDQQRQLQGCFDKYLMSMQDRPWLPESHAGTGWMLAARGMAAESAAAFEEMRRHEPLTAECFLLEAGAATLLGEEERIAGILRQGLELLPDDPQLLLALARDAIRRGEDAQALAICRDLLEADPGNDDAARMLARQLGDSGNHAEAIDVLEQALEASPYNIGILQLLLSECLAEGRTERGREVRALLGDYYPWLEIP